jgi:hypothetical protein
VQQAHDEHEVSYELFENINENLKHINASTQESSNILQEKLHSIEHAITTSSATSLDELKSSMQVLAQNISSALDKISQEQHEANELLKIDTAKESLEAIKIELQGISSVLSTTRETEVQNSQNVLESLNILSQKLQEEMSLLESLEKLSKLSINDGRKQAEVLVKVNKGIQEVSDSVSSASTRTTTILDKKITTIESLLETQTQQQEDVVFQTTQVSQHLKDMQKTITSSNELETRSLTKAEETKILLEKQRELLDLLVGKNDENLNELRRISTGEKSSTPRTLQTEESSGFFSKFFK